MKKISLTLTALLITLLTFAGDVLTLTDGMVFEGKVTKIKGCTISFEAHGNKYFVPAADIYSIQFGDTEDKVYTRYMKMIDVDADKCMNGRIDAQQYHGKKGGHFALGFLFGPFAMIGTAIAKPTPDRGVRTAEMSQHREQFADPSYLTCYTKKAKGQLIGMEALGWGAAIVLLLALSSSSN